jgi:hypothetical protein
MLSFANDHAANVHAPTRGSTPRNSLRCVRVHSGGVNALSPSAICSSRDQCMPGCGRQIPRAPRRQKTTDVSHRCSCAECLRWVSSEATRKRPRPPISLWLTTAGADQRERSSIAPSPALISMFDCHVHFIDASRFRYPISRQRSAGLALQFGFEGISCVSAFKALPSTNS